MVRPTEPDCSLRFFSRAFSLWLPLVMIADVGFDDSQRYTNQISRIYREMVISHK
jgi:hypothetical protein